MAGFQAEQGSWEDISNAGDAFQKLTDAFVIEDAGDNDDNDSNVDSDSGGFTKDTGTATVTGTAGQNSDGDSVAGESTEEKKVKKKTSVRRL